MSKNFEREYKEYLNAQAPDLWDRIEKGISAQPVSEPAAASVISMADEDLLKSDRKRRKRGNYRYYRLIASAAACLIALCLIVPVYRIVSDSGKNSGSDEMGAETEMAKVSNYSQAEAAEEAPAAVEEEAAAEMEMAMAEEASPESNMAETEEFFAESESMDVPASEPADGVTGGTMGGAEAESCEPDSLSTGPTEQELADTQWLEGLGEEIRIPIVILTEGTQVSGGMLHEAILAATSSGLCIQVFVPEDMGISLESGKEYTPTLRKMEEEGYYQLIEMEKDE